MKGKHIQKHNNKTEFQENITRKNIGTNKKRRIIFNILLLIFIAVFLYSGYQVLTWIKSDQQIKKLENGLFSEVVTETENELERTTINFEKLQEVNQDVIAWIRINNTYINYPIMQGETDEYYLRKDINKEYSISGSIFVDASTSENFSDANTIVYGHNMKNGRMFSDLSKIYNGDLGKNIDVEIYLKDKTLRYKVFACYVEEPSLPLLCKKFTQEQKTNYIKQAIAKSEIAFDGKNEIDTTKNILTLITCAAVNTSRIVVHAIQYE